MNWYLDVLKNNYFNFEGRAGRPEFWFFVLFNIIAIVVLLVLSGILRIFFWLYVLYALATLVPALGVGVRRLHDTDRSGWWILLGFIPVAGLVVVVFYILEGTSGDNRFGPPARTAPGA